MAQSLVNRLRRSLVFVGVNLVLAFFMLSFLILPLATAYTENADQIAESREQLGRIRSLQAAGHSPVDAANMLLPGTDEGSVSAALQSDLKSIVATAGAHFVAVRGMEPNRTADSNMVTASIEVRGSVYAVRDVVRRIEDHTPMLIIKSASFRGTSADQDSELQAEFTVQGLMQKRSIDAANVAGRRSVPGEIGR